MLSTISYLYVNVACDLTYNLVTLENFMSTKQLSKWGEMYRNRIGDTYPAYCRQQYQPFLSAIRHAMRQVQMGIVREEG